MLYLFLFLFAVALDMLLGLGGWSQALAGHLAGPASAWRLLRLDYGVHVGHLVLVVPGQQDLAGSMLGWSRLLDMLLWLLAAPFALFIGWHKALLIAAVVLGPLGCGALAVAAAWAVEPWALRRALWLVPLLSVLGLGVTGQLTPARVDNTLPLLALLALMGGCVLRAVRESLGFGFCAGLAGGFAIWLTVQAVPFVGLAYAALVVRWFYARNATILLAMAAGVFDVLCVGLFVDPPLAGYGTPDPARLSYIYLILGLAMMASAACLPRLQHVVKTGRAPLGAVVVVLPLMVWAAVFHITAPVMIGISAQSSPLFLVCGALATLYAIFSLWWAARTRRFVSPLPVFLGHTRHGPIAWAYVGFCVALMTLVGTRAPLFAEMALVLAACLLAVGSSLIASTGLRRLRAGGGGEG